MENPTGVYVMCMIMVVCGTLGLIRNLYNVGVSAKASLLEEMYEQKDINTETYRKYKKKLS